MELYLYRAELVAVVDGDTYDFKVDVGFHGVFAHRFRLFGYDTPEMRKGSPFERERGAAARDLATTWFGEVGAEIYVRTHKADSFGRWLADVHDGRDGEVGDHLGDVLAAADLATSWPTRWREVFDPSV